MYFICRVASSLEPVEENSVIGSEENDKVKPPEREQTTRVEVKHLALLCLDGFKVVYDQIIIKYW